MPKRSVAFMKPDEPAFIKRMKEQIGYQEPPTVETKREILSADDDAVDLDDEKPVVVVLNPGDLSEAEFLKESNCEDETDKKVVFSKPIKKDSEENNSLHCSSKKKDLQNKIASQKEKTKKVKNSCLLSFDDGEDY